MKKGSKMSSLAQPKYIHNPRQAHFADINSKGGKIHFNSIQEHQNHPNFEFLNEYSQGNE